MGKDRWVAFRMAAASYYKLDNFTSSDQNAPPTVYAGSAHPSPNLHPVETGSYQPYHHVPSNDIPDHELPHPIDPPSKPLVQTTSTQAPIPLKLSTAPVAAPNSRLRQRKYQRWRRYLRILKILTKSISTIFSAVMFGIMVFMMVKYNGTKNTFRNGRNAWPRDPKIWPTVMLLVGSGLTLLLSIITLVSYCINFSKARRSWKLTIVQYAIHIVAWIVISTLYRYEKSLHGNNNDLWGWSCSQETTAIQQEFRGVVNFTPLCNVQVSVSSHLLARFEKMLMEV